MFSYWLIHITFVKFDLKIELKKKTVIVKARCKQYIKNRKDALTIHIIMKLVIN